MPETRFEIPQIITDRYAALCDLVQNHSIDGRVKVIDLARYYGCDQNYLADVINTGHAPFAFCPGDKKRAVSYIGVLPLFMFETQGVLMNERFIVERR